MPKDPREQFFDPIEFETAMEDCVSMIRKTLTQRIKDEINDLRRENAELKESAKRMKARELKLNERARLLEEKEETLEKYFYRAKI